MTWQPLSKFVQDLVETAKTTSTTGDFRQDAALVSIKYYGESFVMDQPVCVNHAGLALSMDRLTVHHVTQDAIQRIADTDLHSLPDEPPQLLRRACLIEARKPGKQHLFGNTCCSLGCYELDGAYYLLGFDFPDGAWLAQWKPQWGGGDIDVPVDHSPLIDNVESHHRSAKAAARFLLVLGLLLDATGSPVTRSKPLPLVTGRRRGRRKQGGSEWSVRRISLSGATRGSASSTSEDGEPIPDNYMPIDTMVSGHLKRQPYGPGREKRRWVYVASYGARRWISLKPLRVVVS